MNLKNEGTQSHSFPSSGLGTKEKIGREIVMKRSLVCCVCLLILALLGALSWVKVFRPIRRLADADP